ncbi:sarcosine oxidase subunit delta [Rhodobacter sp. NTK016B]|uniref:sarcosine oxidase subunit delta n=1 Tax=Rhodobacter sp. NTK016B TaxID=2759676 RepID=UPI001A8C19A3|nr:sarcosine oxidase subunit delta [Rhodobacter sp. NTK016B]MBN8291561.1 sarcosine oxidase subunit delta [Rhodobacter sp. NTK016B]
MRLACPCCGPRDRREFTYYGAADYLDRPAPEAGLDAWDAYLHLRDNPAGKTRDLWYHDPCQSWLEVERDTVTHAVHSVQAVAGRHA